MAKKKRAPIQQLRETAKEAEIILQGKGIHTKNSVIDSMAHDRRTRLPGMPEYIPHAWTLAASRKVLANLVKLWIVETKHSPRRQEDHKEFFTFVLVEMGRIEDGKRREVARMPAILKALKGSVLLNQVFSPMQEMETVHTMTTFLVDAFAVAVIVKQHQTVSDFVFWFDSWTKELEQFWVSKSQKDG